MRACAQRVLGSMATWRARGGAARRIGSAPRHLAREERAQATLEYALTLFALMALISGVALLWRAGEQGVLARLVEDACSHALDGLGALDIALF